MTRLNENQIIHRVGQVTSSVTRLTSGLHPDDIKTILLRAGMAILPDTEAKVEPENLDPENLPAELLASIRSGLASGNAQAMRVAMDWLDQWAGKTLLNELTVEIVDYRIKDASLAKIVSEADDEILAGVEEALEKRRSPQQSNH